MKGINGFNVRILGVSRDQVKAAQVQVQGAFMLCMNDPDLVREAKALGVTTIYRQSGDDPDHNPLPESNQSAVIKAAAIAFVRTRAEKGADYIHLTNELSSTPKLHEFTRYALEDCHANGWKGIAYSYATHTRRQQFVEALDNLRYAVHTNQAVGVHLYPDDEHDATVAEWLDIRRSLGGLWIATEFNYSESYDNPFRGLRLLPREKRAAFVRKWSAWLDAEQIPACWFSYDYWDRPTVQAAIAAGYGYWDLPDVRTEMAAQNHIHVFKGVPPMPPTTTPAPAGARDPFETRTTTALRLRPAAAAVGATIRIIPEGEAVIVYETPVLSGGMHEWAYTKDALGNTGYTAVEYEPGKPSYNPPLPEPPTGGITLTQAEVNALVITLENAIATLRGNKYPEIPFPAADPLS